MLNSIRSAFDVIVLGVGSMGSAACCFLAERGHAVLGIEQFAIPHEKGSHAGQSRMIRKAYFEHPDYVPLLERAYENWRSLEKNSGSQVYFRTGLVYFGRGTDPIIQGVRESAARYGIQVNSLSESETARKYSRFRLPSSYERLEEPDAGFLVPERCILLYTERAIRHGATVLTNTRVVDWTRDGHGIRVRTDRGEFSSRKLVITAGPWAGKMIPGLSASLQVTRQVVAWVIPTEWEPFTIGRFPCWIADDFYGVPVLPVSTFGGPIGLKVARHHPGRVSDPDNLNRAETDEDEREILDALHRFLPGTYRRTHVMKVCMYTNTPDQHFILDYLPGFDRDVVIAVGFSGHGFKFSSVVGEIMADLAMNGGTSLPISFLGVDRIHRPG